MTATRSQVLFVDDDANVVASIRRAFRGKASSWQLHCANGGQEALEVVRSTEIDAVITDMRMPVMDGATLLARVHELHPNSVRMVLSGQSDRAYSIAAAKYAHRFLSKPCPAEQLSEHIRSTLEARAKLSALGATDLVGLREVCVQTEVLKDLNGLNSALPFDPDEVCSWTRGHSGILLKLLQLVASSFFSPMRPTLLLREAVGSLGPEVLRSLLHSGMFRPAADAEQQALAECHRVAGRTLMLTQRIASECQLSSKERELLGTASQLVSVNRALRSQPFASESKGPDVWRNCATNAAESSALLQLWGVPEVLTQAVSDVSLVADNSQATIRGSVVALAVALAHGACSTDAVTSEYPRAALDDVLRLKSLETWAHSASDWCSQEICG